MRATFVKSLNLEDVSVIHKNKDDDKVYRYYERRQMVPVFNVDPDDEVVVIDDYTLVVDAPVYKLYSGMYIAYSREVQELLAMPFDELSKQVKDQHDTIMRLNRDLRSVATARFWDRLKYLFSGRQRTLTQKERH